jgi:enterobacterial common antigen flippase
MTPVQTPAGQADGAVLLGPHRHGGNADGVAAQASSHGHSHYRQILKSSALIGSSSLVNAVLGIVRAKAMALLVGPAGVGLMGALTSVFDLTRCVAEMGLNSSGVRQIAESAGSADQQRVARTAHVLRRTALALGILGAVALAALSIPVAQLTFGDSAHASAVAILSLAVLCRILSDGQGALLQGLRRIREIAVIGVIGAITSTAVCVALVFVLGMDGIALSIVAIAAISLLLSWWASRELALQPVQMTSDQTRAEVKSLLRMGLAFMGSTLLTLGAAYLVRMVIVRQESLYAAGLYQAAWAMAGLFVSFVLQAMSTDFYPRLVGAANDNALCNRLVNEQALVSLLLAATGVVATLTFSPWALLLLYSREFAAADELMRWICMGMAVRVLTWPLGYVLIAKGKQMLFVGADLMWSVVCVALTWWCVEEFGLRGAGIAYFASYAIHLMVLYPICRRLSGFRWAPRTRWAAVAFLAAALATHLGYLFLGRQGGLAVGIFFLIASAVVSVLALRRSMQGASLPKKLQWLAHKPRAQQ